ncbi:MAG: SDR family oxidoreductase [Acidobacteria bacterium]|nr:SDR family oxidoreductase [Acidobacteriota bacterium]
MKLAGKAALITGGTKGIGASTAIALARAGSHIAINGRVMDQAAADVIACVEAEGRRCVMVAADLTLPEESARCVHEAAEALGGLNMLVHCAGAPVRGSLLEIPVEAWYKAFDLHLHAAFHLCRGAVPIMKKRGEGAIIFVSSAAGSRGCAGTIAYGVVKGALPQFARALARELADDNIRVNCVSPGVIRTRFQDMLTAEQVKNNLDNRIPLHREGTPEDVAEAIVMLARNNFITGETLAIDGGMTMRMV